jgi:predicted MFS family arabinose efflux permease
MSGLLIGTFVARTFSGALAALGGWRLVHAVVAVLMLSSAIGVRAALPTLPARAGLAATERRLLAPAEQSGEGVDVRYGNGSPLHSRTVAGRGTGGQRN